MDRTIHFGDDAADARYRIQDTSSTGGDLVLAEDLDGGTVLLEYDYSASEWVSRGPVNLSGNDITNAGAISASSLDANQISIGSNSSIQTVSSEQELTDAISNASDGDAIFLGSFTDTQNRTIEKKLAFYGTAHVFGGSSIDGDWTVNDFCSFIGVSLSNSATVALNGSRSVFTAASIGGSTQISSGADRVEVSSIRGGGGDIKYQSGTSGGIFDTITGATVTDNGANKAGVTA